MPSSSNKPTEGGLGGLKGAKGTVSKTRSEEHR